MDGKLVIKNQQQQQQWGSVKEETFSSDHHFQWPGKNYSCNFCRREFKSAQALGGHMNVHRRDRARLRLLPSWVTDNNNSYPNPNLSLSSAPFIINSVSFIDVEDQNKKINPNSSSPQDHDDDDDDYEVPHVLKKKKKNASLENFEGPSNINEDLDLELHL